MRQVRAALIAPVLSLLMAARLGCQTTISAQQPPAIQTGTRLDFQDVRLSDLIRSLSSLIGVNVVLADVPDKRLTFTTSGPVRASDLPGILESILEANGLVAVQQGMVTQIYASEKAPPTGQVRFGADFPDPPPLGIVTQLVPLQSIQADEGAAALKQIASPTARIEAVARSNSLLITDRGVHVARYLDVLRRLDERPQGEAGLRTYVVSLKYAHADDLAESLGQLFGIAVATGAARSLDDLSLSRQLEGFRQRENDSFRMRSGANVAAPAVTTLTPRGESAAADSARARSGALVGQTTIVSSGPTNALIIRTAPPNYPLLLETIQALDLRPAQVLFEVTVAEITLGKGDEWGIDWDEVGGSVQTSFGSPSTADTTSPSSLVMRFVSLRTADIRAVLRTIATKSQVRVLSTPELLATNNREARVLVGSRVPFIASTRLGNDVAIDRSVQYENVGTQLTLIPTINDDDYVSVQVLQEVSSLTSRTVTAALDAPVISTREASTRAVIRNGQTVVIAGLIGTDEQDIERGVPFLKDVPILGYLFKSRSVTHNRTELAIFVTPYLIRNDTDADLLRERIRKGMNDRVPGTLPDTGVIRPPAPRKPPEQR